LGDLSPLAQPPQFFGSSNVLVHLPPQHTVFGGWLQLFPQPPQFRLLEFGSKHCPLQQMNPVGQAGASAPQLQKPPLHVVPSTQTAPQPPQLLLSLVVSTSFPLQHWWKGCALTPQPPQLG
jgi:hypothetical protein